MIGLALLAAAAVAQTPVDAERAFAAMAKTDGQWTAFRAFAADDAILFVPQAEKAHAWLKDRKDPPAALTWSPSRSWLSCDGKTGYNTGPWSSPGGKAVGYFSTLWRKQADGSWKWLIDHGDALASPIEPVAAVEPRQASCKGKPKPGAAWLPAGTAGGFQASADGTLAVTWAGYADTSSVLLVQLWTGHEYETVFESRIAAPKP